MNLDPPSTLTPIDALRDTAKSDAERGAEAAHLLWNDAPGSDEISDPRTNEFARAVIDGLVTSFHGSSGVVKKVLKNAAKAAADLNVAQFQGLIEIVQNADDLRATEVRFALREKSGMRQLLVVHNGTPVTCQHVLGMALPYLTTKTNRTDQRGRFGIGLKTLNRIATSIAIHSAPYHFEIGAHAFAPAVAEPDVNDFYSSSSDTLLVLELRVGFEEHELKRWFEAWDDDGLLFLGFVRRFRWCTSHGETLIEKSVTFSSWESPIFSGLHQSVRAIAQRRVHSAEQSWMVWKATVTVPEELHPAHKVRTATTDISIAVPDSPSRSSLHIGFKTLIPVGVPFSLDGQFDPSTARETLIENPWNSWLIDCCADVVADIAAGLLASAPLKAWPLVPLKGEQVGMETHTWLRSRFEAAFRRTSGELGATASLLLESVAVRLASVVYEIEVLSDLLTADQLELLAPGCRALPVSVRDSAGRWRAVLDAIGVSSEIGTGAFLGGFDKQLFVGVEPSWWVRAADRLTRYHPANELNGRPFWLREDCRPVSAVKKGATARLLVFGGESSIFAMRWHLLDRLHPAYEHNAGEYAVAWLEKNASFTHALDAATELAAFAERYAAEPLEIAHADLRELRDRFDEVRDARVEELGVKIGAALLLDGYFHERGKLRKQKVSPPAAYLCKTLDSDHPDWCVAAEKISGIHWISPHYNEELKTSATRLKRRRADGTISRGPRKFLMLLGAEVTPRLERTGVVEWGTHGRVQELRAAGAEQVSYDYVSPDLDRVLGYFHKASQKDVKGRSPALLRALSRNWDRVYKGKQTVPSQHLARVYIHEKAKVTASWLEMLRTNAWIAISRGKPVRPTEAVIKTSETQSLYSTFVLDVDAGEVSDELCRALGLIVDVRIGDLLSRIQEIRDGEALPDESYLLQIYRNIATRCPVNVASHTRIGELMALELRHRFDEGTGLIYMGVGQWRRPSEVLRGKDIFSERQRFVPGGPTVANLWLALEVREPNLDDCIGSCKKLAAKEYSARVSAVLMDTYRHMESLLATAERRHRERLKVLPVNCYDRWTSDRPVYFVEASELRNQLTDALPHYRFWTPPCDTRDLPRLMSFVGITTLNPVLEVIDSREGARKSGETLGLRFGDAVDHLSNELARNDPHTRDSLDISWDALKTLPLFMYERPFLVQVTDSLLSVKAVPVYLKAWIADTSLELHVTAEGLGHRDYGGRAIASLFAADVRRKIGAEWVLAWQKSLETRPELIRLASDEQRLEALKTRADKINATPKRKITVTAPGNRIPAVEARTLKDVVGTVSHVTVNLGIPQRSPVSGILPKLSLAAPERSTPNSFSSSPVAYSNAELEEHGWRLLTAILNTSEKEELVDFRRRHRVGADGAIDWKTFVEMKATGRGPQSSIEMSNAEYERAKKSGTDFILALVSGLESGQQDEVRLIIDPANCISARPVNGMRLSGLLDAPCILIEIDGVDPVATG